MESTTGLDGNIYSFSRDFKHSNSSVCLVSMLDINSLVAYHKCGGDCCFTRALVIAESNKRLSYVQCSCYGKGIIWPSMG